MTVRLVLLVDGKTAIVDLVSGRHIEGTQHWNENEIADLVRPHLKKYLAVYPEQKPAPGEPAKQRWCDKYGGLYDGDHCEMCDCPLRGKDAAAPLPQS